MPTHSLISRKNNRPVRSTANLAAEVASVTPETSQVAGATTLQTPVRPERTVEWLGGINYGALERVLGSIKNLMSSSADEIVLLISSYGGATGVGMSFYDAVTGWLRPNLVTIGSGDVDSSGIIVFLAGRRRFITRNTTLLFHLAGRTLEKDIRHSSADLESMVKEDKIKDEHYARVVAEACGGSITSEYVLDLMKRNTLLTAEEAVTMGLAHGIV